MRITTERLVGYSFNSYEELITINVAVPNETNGGDPETRQEDVPVEVLYFRNAQTQHKVEIMLGPDDIYLMSKHMVGKLDDEQWRALVAERTGIVMP